MSTTSNAMDQVTRYRLSQNDDGGDLIGFLQNIVRIVSIWDPTPHVAKHLLLLSPKQLNKQVNAA
ncbi:MAG: hypothetical protein SFV81_10180 [Pirellulaceae bacterium]|nr:hypothetical protein [Pirellulaceae bacterium]